MEYCRFWRRKLDGSEDVEFPEVLDKAIAKITQGFSFAYMQEAFVASLLAIAAVDAKEDEQNGVDSNGGGEEKQDPTRADGGKSQASQLSTTVKNQELENQLRQIMAECMDHMESQGPTTATRQELLIQIRQALADIEAIDTRGASIAEPLSKNTILAEVARAMSNWGSASGTRAPEEQIIRRALILYNNHLPPAIDSEWSYKEAMGMRYCQILEIAGIGWTKADYDDWQRAEDNKPEILRRAKDKRKNDELEKYILWRQMKKQVAILRKELGAEEEEK